MSRQTIFERLGAAFGAIVMGVLIGGRARDD